VKEKKSLIYNLQPSFPNNEPTDVGLGIKPKSTHPNIWVFESWLFFFCGKLKILMKNFASLHLWIGEK